MSSRSLAIIACLVTLTAVGSRAEAQYRARGHGSVGIVLVPHGLYVGAGLVGTHILDQRGGSELLDDGAGLSLYTGIRLNPRLALELGWVGTFHNPANVNTVFGNDVDYLVLNGFTGDAKIYLDSASPTTAPFLQGGLGLYFLDSTYFGTQSVGTGFQLGGGVDFHVGPRVDLGLRGLYRGMAMGPPDSATNDTFVSALTAEGQLTVGF